METASAVRVSEAWWAEACKKVKKSVVFLDNSVAECLHWNGGLSRLLDAGAKNVKEFSSFESGNKEDAKAVFMVSTAIRDTTGNILQDIIQSSSFEYCIVITCAHPNVHAFARYGGRETEEALIIGQLQNDVLTWMGNMNYTAEIFYMPLVVVPYSARLFLMPGFAELYPLLQSDVMRIAKLQLALSKGDKPKQIDSLGDVEFHHLPHEMRILVRQYVSCLHSLLQGMNVRDEIFTIGHTSRIIGAELDAFPPAKQRRKTANGKVSVVLMDRTLDLSSATSHTADTLMDRILALLPRLYGHQVDTAVNMSPMCQVHLSSEWTLVPGCLAPQPNEERAKSSLSALVMSPKKEALTLLNKHILEAASRKGFEENSEVKDVKITPENLKRSIQQFASDVDAFAENASLLQQGLGVVEALLDPSYSHLDQLLSLEKLLLQSIGDPEETPPFTQIFQLMKTRSSRGVTLDDILNLMVYVTSLAGSQVFTQREEYALINLLSHAIVEDKIFLSDRFLELVGDEVDEVSALKAAQSIAGQLHAIAGARNHLRNYRNLHIPGDGTQPARSVKFLKTLVHDCLSAPQAEITDLEYRSAGLKDLIKTGFSLFVSVSKPMPRDAPTMLVVVVGGITSGEVLDIKEAVTSANPACEVIVASSHLTHPTDATFKALQPNRFLRQV